MFFVIRTQVWTLPETKLLEISTGRQLLDDPLSVVDVLELCTALQRWQDLSTYGDVCIENDTVVLLPRKKGLLDSVVKNPWTYVGAFASAIPAAAVAGVADAILNKNPKGGFSEKDRISGALFGEVGCPKISAKYGVDIREQVRIHHPVVLVTDRTRNAFQRWQNLSVDKSVCMQVFIGEIQVADKRTRGVITYPLSDATSAEDAIKQLINEAGLSPRQVKQIAPLDLSKKGLRGLEGQH